MNKPSKLLEYYFPLKMSKRSLDRYLAAGWFRTTNMLFRSQVTCFDNDICSPINIRLRLDTHEFTKRFKKLITRNSNLFRFEIKKCKSLSPYEEMFAIHQKRFKSFLCHSLQEFLTLSRHFDTYEVCVYDDNRLIAVSFFDLGENSVMSLLGLFDPRYSSYSLGIFTMLIEIEFAKSSQYKLYYPGYVHGGPSIYDYKLRLGSVETYNWDSRRWVRHADPHLMPNMAETIKKHSHLLAKLLQDLDLEYDQKINLFFGWYYYQFMYRDLYKHPFMLILNDSTVLAYDAETSCYVHSSVELYIPFRDINLVLANDFDKKVHCMDVMKESAVLLSTPDINKLKRYLTKYFK